jgi:hypothetical protein
VTLADRIRAIAAAPTPAALAELPGIAVEVGRMEAALDELAGDASEQAAIVAADTAQLARQRRALRNRARMVVRNG